ncbi:hypothetical protein M407DRAFT_233051 [Tulasnella calospora MUT 4182]|uniref:F-box domain-containing protein n=1 Tax=Tulasnella calospora MUT 4182 TaxID=1051891 RepID=A0A0C3MIB7_9AGAM|nr:hypothetical protein M407DRAFT_233051 [Tulasnella calospora MUT 4182]
MEATTELAITSTATVGKRRRHNEHPLVHDLPPEVLYNVFKDGYRKRDYQSLFAIRSVCKYWMEIVDSCPELWTFVSSMHNGNLVDMILQKSKNQFLSFEYDNGSRPNRSEIPIERRTSILTRIWALADRLKWLDGESCDGGFVRFLCYRFQNLETLRVHNPCQWDHLLHRRLLRAPKLRYVAVQGLTLAWEHLSGLRTLIITQPTVDPTVNELYILFTNCPRLEVLRIQGDALDPWSYKDDDVALPSAPVFLPHLQYLLLFEVRLSSYSRLLPLIEAPNLLRLFFFRKFSPFDVWWNTSMFEPVERFFGSYAHSLNDDRDGGRLRISGSRYSFTISVGACKVMQYYPSGWKWKGDGYDYSVELSAALSSFDRRLGDNIKAIHFGGTRSREDLIILGPIFQRHFPNVEELVVTLSSSERRPDAHLVLEALASPLSLEGVARWLFPGLTTLHLKACREPVCDGVLGVIEARRNGEVQGIQRVSIKNGRIGRDAVAKLKASLQGFRIAGTRYVDTGSEEA